MKTKTIEIIKNYLLENPEERLQICKEIDSYDGSMEFTRVTSIEELAETMNAYELARAIIYGDVDNIDFDVRFNAYANLESVTSYDLEDESESYIEEIIDFIEDYGVEEFTNEDFKSLYNESEENQMKEILLTLKGLSQEQGEKILEEKGYIIDDSFAEKCANSENYFSDTYYRIRYGNYDEWFCYTAEYIPDEDYVNEGEFIRGYWNCNTENDITISELEL